MLSNGITINAGNGSDHDFGTGDGIRIFNIIDTSTFGSDPPLVTMIGLKLTGGDIADNGGAIQSTGMLELVDCTIFGNYSTNSGGGVYVNAGGIGTLARNPLTIQNSTIRNNTAESGGVSTSRQTEQELQKDWWLV
jgi:hypothetical protein